MRYEALLAEALRLPAHQRDALAHRLLASLESEVEVTATWEAEWTEALRGRLTRDDGQRFDLGQTLAELRAGREREASANAATLTARTRW